MPANRRLKSGLCLHSVTFYTVLHESKIAPTGDVIITPQLVNPVQVGVATSNIVDNDLPSAHRIGVVLGDGQVVHVRLTSDDMDPSDRLRSTGERDDRLTGPELTGLDPAPVSGEPGMVRSGMDGLDGRGRSGGCGGCLGRCRGCDSAAQSHGQCHRDGSSDAPQRVTQC